MVSRRFRLVLSQQPCWHHCYCRCPVQAVWSFLWLSLCHFAPSVWQSLHSWAHSLSPFGPVVVPEAFFHPDNHRLFHLIVAILSSDSFSRKNNLHLFAQILYISHLLTQALHRLTQLWTEHNHTRIFSAHLYTHPLRTCTCIAQSVWASVFVKRALIHTSSRVWSFVVSPPIELFLSFDCLYILSNLFTSFVLLIFRRNRRVQEPLRTRRMRSVALWRYNPPPPSHKLWAPAARQLRLLRGLYSDLLEWIRRQKHGTVVLVRCGTRRWAYQKSAILTTVHSGARRTSELGQTYHSHEESLLPAQSFFKRTSTERPVYEPSSNLSQKRKSSRDLENERVRILLARQKEQILAEVKSEIQKHELQAESDKRSIQEVDWNDWFSANGNWLIL